MARKTKTLAEQLEELDNPAPKDFDPEEEAPQSDSDADSGADEDNENAAREHYVDVGKSKLRKRDIVPLGPRYEGSKVSRDAVTADEDEDDPFSKGFDEEESEDDVDGVQDESASEEDEEEGEEGESEDEEEDMQDGEESPATDLSDDGDEEEDDDDDDDEDEDQAEDRTELRKMMAEEQKTVAASLSQAAKQDAEKGRAVKTQRSTFDSLLNARIKLQKALIGANTISGLQESGDAADTPEDAFRAAETAAFTLWSSLNSLRETLESSRNGRKRTHDEFTIDTPTEDLWAHMKAQEVSSHTYRNTVLEKWSAKARGATGIASRNRLNNTAAQQTIVDVLQEQLTGSDRLVKRARTPRSCAPLQVSRKVTEADNIYDDADFYGLLLQSLLEQRSADSVAASASNVDVSFQMRREAKTKKNIDTKASKGRKLRYTVHEKLQNFMAPEDRSSWGERQADELFGSLFGQRMGLGEEDEEDAPQDEDANMEEAGLMMFRS